MRPDIIQNVQRSSVTGGYIKYFSYLKLKIDIRLSSSGKYLYIINAIDGHDIHVYKFDSLDSAYSFIETIYDLFTRLDKELQEKDLPF